MSVSTPPSAGDPSPDWRSSLSSAVADVNLQVTPENVLDVRNVLLTEADRLRTFGGQNMMMAQLVGRCGGDPISDEAQAAFSQRIGVLVQQCQQYSDQLRDAGNALDAVAKQYGYSEEQIESSFKSIDAGGLA